MAYKDKDRQREANKEWVRQKRAENKGTTSVGTTEQQLLHNWAIGKGDDYQQGLGVLAAQYNATNNLGDDVWGKGVLEDAGWWPARMHNTYQAKLGPGARVCRGGDILAVQYETTKAGA